MFVDNNGEDISKEDTVGSNSKIQPVFRRMAAAFAFLNYAHLPRIAHSRSRRKNTIKKHVRMIVNNRVNDMRGYRKNKENTRRRALIEKGVIKPENGLVA